MEEPYPADEANASAKYPQRQQNVCVFENAPFPRLHFFVDRLRHIYAVCTHGVNGVGLYSDAVAEAVDILSAVDSVAAREHFEINRVVPQYTVDTCAVYICGVMYSVVEHHWLGGRA